MTSAAPPSTARHRLRAIHFLERGAREGVAPVGPGEAAARLLECVLCFRDDAGRSGTILQSAARAVMAVPCFRLSYDAARTGWRELARRLTECERSRTANRRA